ncbi:SDR family oxidoreductase [Candidatus Saccharibacteria bacterium]|nr:SDR family oxidoreductase [Candidatus Saccharibacteria bacterium]
MPIPINELLNLANKTAVVTGGAVGIGKGIADRLHEAGASVIIADVDDPAAKTAADELNAKRAGSALAVHVDVSSADDVNKLIQTTVGQFASLDILVNNAGIYPAKSLHDMANEDFKKVLDINLHGAYLCTKYASEQMISQGHGGKIINITSIDALHPSMVGLAHYDASKHGLWGFTKNVALELASHKIWVNAIAPGGIATPGVAKMQSPAQPGVDMKAVMDAFLAKIPMHRMGEPDEIGKTVLFLASDMASYMTGSQIVVDGGALLS